MFELSLLLFLILLNGFFAFSELSLFSAKVIRIEQLASVGNRGAMTALELINNPTNLLSTVQIGITGISIVSGAFGESMLADKITPYLVNIPYIGVYNKTIATTFVILFLTLTSLLLGELIPKRLALINPEKMACLVSIPMQFLLNVLHPLVKVLSLSTNAFLKVFKIDTLSSSKVTEEEIHGIIEQGAEAGILDENEHEMVRNIMKLDGIRIASIMTLRKDIVHFDMSDDPILLNDLIKNCKFSKIIISKGTMNNIQGYVSIKDLLKNELFHNMIDLQKSIKKVLTVPEIATSMQVLEQFKSHRSHFAVVVDEHGQTSGLITLNDILGAIVGDIDNTNVTEPDFVQRSDGSWLINAQCDIDEFKKAFEIDLLPSEDDVDFHTLAGFILTEIGRIPRVTDVIEIDGFVLEVMDMDGNRIDKVLLQKK